MCDVIYDVHIPWILQRRTHRLAGTEIMYYHFIGSLQKFNAFHLDFAAMLLISNMLNITVVAQKEAILG